MKSEFDEMDTAIKGGDPMCEMEIEDDMQDDINILTKLAEESECVKIEIEERPGVPPLLKRSVVSVRSKDSMQSLSVERNMEALDTSIMCLQIDRSPKLIKVKSEFSQMDIGRDGDEKNKKPFCAYERNIILENCIFEAIETAIYDRFPLICGECV